MTARTRVQLADERSDRPRWLAIAGVACAGLAAGVLFALAFGDSQSENDAIPNATAATVAVDHPVQPAKPGPPVAVDDVPLSAAAPNLPTNIATGPIVPSEPAPTPTPEATAQAVPPVTSGPAPALSGGAASDVAATAVPAAGVAPAPTTAIAPAPAAAGAQHTIVHGQLAYLRCEGVPLEAGPYPCPRDRHLERQVWSAVDALQQCALPALSTPDVELRVELRSRGGKHALEVRPADGSEAFARAATACLAPPLESVRTQLRPIFMVVAFRFEVQ